MSVEYELQALMVDNDPGWAKARFQVSNQRYLQTRVVQDEAPYPIHMWTLDDAPFLASDIERRDLLRLFSIALSMQAWLFVHSPIIICRATSAEVGVTVGMHGYVITISEDVLVSTFAGLQRTLRMRGDRGKMMRASINAYWDAVQSGRTRARFLNLWAALELATRAEYLSGDGVDLDKQISKITSITTDVIQPL